MNVLERVGQLIGMTGSSSEEEARTMALTACRLIREHGLVVLEPSDPRLYARRAQMPTPIAAPASSRRGPDLGDLVDAALRGVKVGVRFAADVVAASAPATPARVAAEVTWSGAAPKRRRRRKVRRWRPR